jgi:hypothetical protein
LSQPGGTGGPVPGQGGQAGSPTTSQSGTGGDIVLFGPNCNSSDQQVTSGPGLDYSADCPAERECYSLVNNWGSTLCVLPEGTHCSDLLSCDPGDTPTTPGSQDCGVQDYCYTKKLCAQSIGCKPPPYGGICSGTWSDAGILEPPDASADSSDTGTIPCCGDGTVDSKYGEGCDLGPLNGVRLNTNKSSPLFWNPDPGGIVLCDWNCTNPNILCELDWKGGMMCD